METWHNRLDFALNERGEDWKSLFEYLRRRIGISKPSVYAWKPESKKRTEMMNGDNAALVCEFLKIKSDWLFHNRGDSGLLPSPDTQASSNDAESVKTNSNTETAMLLNFPKMAPDTITASDYVRFEFHNVPMSAGPGSLAESYNINEVEEFNVARWWAMHFVGSVDTKKIKVVPCRGSSMSPTIPNGSMMFVDVSVRSHIGDGIYCINIDDRLLVKRVNIRSKEKVFEVISDNPTGPSTEIYGIHEEDRISICGKVVTWLALRRDE